MTALIDLNAELAAGAELQKNAAKGAASIATKATLEKVLAQAPADQAPPKLAGLLKRAVRMIDQKGPAEGARIALKALDLAPEHPLSNHVMALCLERLGRLSKSLEFYERAWRLDPKNPEIYQNLGMVAWKLDMLDAAEKFIRLFAQMAPDSAAAAINLSGVLRDQGKFSDAIELLRAAIYRTPDNAELWNSLGTVLLEAGDPEQAATFYLEALRLKEGFSRAHHNLAYTLELRGDVEGAVEHFNKALENPQSETDRITMEHGLALTTLALGKLEEGWRRYAIRLDPRFEASTFFQYGGKMWDGADPAALAGKTVLVSGEQGLGDEIMFAQMLPDIIEAVGPEGEVRLATERRLVALMQRSFPQVKVACHYTVSREGREFRFAPDLTKDGKVDLWFPIANACRSFRTRFEDFAEGAFLTADEELVEQFRAQLAGFGPGLKVGLLWKSLKMTAKRTKFFSGFEAWKPVLTLPGIEFVNLQYGDVAAELARAKTEFGVTIHQPEGLDLKDDLDHVAALGTACDLVVGPMNATINLTAASGGRAIVIQNQRRTWVNMGQDRLPWYPQIEVVYSDAFGNWGSLMDSLAARLSREARAAAA